MIFWTVNLRAFSIIITHFRYKLIEQPKTQVQDDFSLSKLICYWFYFRRSLSRAERRVIRGLTAVHVLTLGLHSILLIIWSNIQRVHFQDIGTTASLWTGRQQVSWRCAAERLGLCCRARTLGIWSYPFSSAEGVHCLRE